MKGGFFKKPRPDGEARAGSDCGKRDWPEDLVDTIVQVFLEILGAKDNLGWNDLERRLRTGTGTREYNDMTSLHGHGHSHGYYGQGPEPDDVVARMMKQCSSPAALQDYVETIMEQAATMLGRVKAKGKEHGDIMDTEAELQCSQEILRETLIRHILKVINSLNSTSHAAGSHDGGLLATPQGYMNNSAGGELNSLTGDCIRGLMEHGYGLQDNFMEGTHASDIYKEMEFLEFDGKFMEVQQMKLIGMRKDKIGWFCPDDLDREKQPGLSALLKRLISLPFELNKKANLCLQGSAQFQFACYLPGAFYKTHVDGGYEQLNNGRKVTALYYPNTTWSDGDGGELRVYKRRRNPFQIEKLRRDGVEFEDDSDAREFAEDVAPVGDRLVLFRSRDIPHEVLTATKKRFAVTLWIPGPPGPGDQPDGYYTPT